LLKTVLEDEEEGADKTLTDAGSMLVSHHTLEQIEKSVQNDNFTEIMFERAARELEQFLAGKFQSFKEHLSS